MTKRIQRVSNFNELIKFGSWLNNKNLNKNQFQLVNITMDRFSEHDDDFVKVNYGSHLQNLIFKDVEDSLEYDVERQIDQTIAVAFRNKFFS